MCAISPNPSCVVEQLAAQHPAEIALPQRARLKVDAGDPVDGVGGHGGSTIAPKSAPGSQLDKITTIAQKSSAVSSGELRLRRYLDAGRPRRRLGLHRPPMIENATAPTASTATPAAASTSGRGRRLGLRASAIACGRFAMTSCAAASSCGDGLLRVLAISLASRLFSSAFANAAGGRVRTLPAQPDGAPRHVDGSHRGVASGRGTIVRRGSVGHPSSSSSRTSLPPCWDRCPACHQRQPTVPGSARSRRGTLASRDEPHSDSDRDPAHQSR